MDVLVHPGDMTDVKRRLNEKGRSPGPENGLYEVQRRPWAIS